MTSATSRPTFDNPGRQVTRPSKLAHVVLRTNNFAELCTFYKTFLGGEAVFENDFLAFITYDEEHHRIGIVKIPDIAPKKVDSNGLEHVAFTFSSLESLAMAYLQRKEHGILPFWQINHGPTTSVYYKDPDGNILETQVENFGTVKEAMDFMNSEAYAINPLGVDFDMEDLIRRMKAGEDEVALKKRPASGPRGLDTVPA